MSDFPGSARPSPDTTKILHLALYLNVLILLYTFPIVHYMTDFMFLT